MRLCNAKRSLFCVKHIDDRKIMKTCDSNTVLFIFAKFFMNIQKVMSFKVGLFCLCLVSALSFSQVKPKINWSLFSQVWLRYSELNEGTLVNGEAASDLIDVSIRRLRIPVSSQISPKVFAYALFGGNNYNIATAQDVDFPLKVLDLYVEYAFSKVLEMGIGKSGWQGLNRWNVRSAKSLMALDAPLFSLNTVEKTDDLARNLGVWFKGKVGKVDYRVSVVRPNVVKSIPNGDVDFANNKPNLRSGGYLKYQFFEHESNKGAYQTGTYINKKKVLNIGAGFQYQKDALSDGDVALVTTNLFDIRHWAVDSFLSLPLFNGEGITAYLGFYHYDFGEEYIRNVGANGVAFSGGSDFNGAGISFPLIGSGDSVFTQFGYAFSEVNMGSEVVVFQPNIAVQYSDWNLLNQSMVVYDCTVNAYLDGHDHKISLGYQSRPIFGSNSLIEVDRKGMWVLQYQFGFGN